MADVLASVPDETAVPRTEIGHAADTDDRVVPGHSFKYAAALQAAELAAAGRGGPFIPYRGPMGKAKAFGASSSMIRRIGTVRPREMHRFSRRL